MKDDALPGSGKPEIWWAFRRFHPGQVSPEWVCVVTQNWSKACELMRQLGAEEELSVVSRATDWHKALGGLPGFRSKQR